MMLPRIRFLVVAIAALLSYAPAGKAQSSENKSKPASTKAQPGDNFLGEWEWSDNGEIFHITLERNPKWPVPFSATGRTANVIYGNFWYNKNGTTIVASLRDPASADNGLFNSKIERQKIVMNFYDKVHEKSGLVVLVFLPNSNDQITWKLQQIEEEIINNTTPPNFSVPTNVTLTRQ